jgi:hypothetical protein
MVETEGTELPTPHPVIEPVSDTRARNGNFRCRDRGTKWAHSRPIAVAQRFKCLFRKREWPKKRPQRGGTPGPSEAVPLGGDLGTILMWVRNPPPPLTSA